jgi:hypothetical protein
MTLKWSYVDATVCALRLPDSKTGAKIVHIGKPALELLMRIERVEKNPWVIVGMKPDARLTDLQPFWHSLGQHNSNIVAEVLNFDSLRLPTTGVPTIRDRWPIGIRK